MKRFLVSLAVCLSTIALAQDTGATTTTTTTAEAPTGPDVTRMPFTPDSIKQIVTHHMEQIQGCHERTMAETNKHVEGKLVAAWTITSEGLVKNAKIQKKGSTAKDADLHRCVEAVILSMTFPSPGPNKEVPIEYPFNLKPVK